MHPLRSLLLVFCAGIAAAAGAIESVEITPPEFRGAVQPQVAVAPSGEVHVVFGQGNAVYHTAAKDGRHFSPPVKVGELEKLALKMRRGPRVTATDQLILVTAISHADGNVHAWRSTDGGKTFSAAGTVNTTPRSATEGLQAMAGDGRGTVGIVWNDNREGVMQVWARFSTDGGMSWGEERKVYAAPQGPICPCCHPSIALAPSGEFALMWRNSVGGFRDMYLRTTADLGKSFSPAQKLGEGTWKFEGCPMDGGSVAASPDGKWIAAWRRETNLFAHPVGASEAKFAENARQPVLGFAGNQQFSFWEENGALMMQSADQKSELAKTGASASVVNGAKAITIAWEGEGGSLRLAQMPAGVK